MKQYTFTLEFVNEILACLGEQPAKGVFGTILKIHQEVARQEAEQQNPQETSKE